jgi:hypothetical protein
LVDGRACLTHIIIGLVLAIALLYFRLISPGSPACWFLMFAPLLACLADRQTTGPN